MDESPHEPVTTADGAQPRRAAGLHDRLDEIELILSGAVVFALIQLPERVDQLYLTIAPKVSGLLWTLALVGFYYVKLILYTLILTFVVHLVVRAFWVALEGLDSVFPEGVRWDRMNLGPVARRVFPETIPTIRSLANRADALASVLFSAAFYLVLFVAILTLLVFAVVPAVALGLGALPIPIGPGGAILLSMVVLALVFVGPRILDRLVGDRLSPESRAGRLLEAVLRTHARVLGLTLAPPIRFTLASHLGRWRAGLAVGVAFAGLLTFFVVDDILVPEDNLVFASSRVIPVEAGSRGVEPRYYEAYRTNRQVEYPSIPSEIVSEDLPWVRLFVPYRPTEDEVALNRLCPAVQAGGERGLRLRGTPSAPPESLDPQIDEALDCVASLWEVSLDGAPLDQAPGNEASGPVFLRHPDTGIRGVARYVDVRELAPGRHVLTVTRSMGARPAGASTPPPRHEILFWR